MELLVVTLAYTTPGREGDGQIRVRRVCDMLRSAPGLLTVRSYTGRDRLSYLLLTTWEDEQAWQEARERYSPRNLLQQAIAHTLTAPPEQWLMRYLWGYNRPAAAPTSALALLATIRAEQLEQIEQSWLENLRRQAIEPVLAFSFLARGVGEETLLSAAASQGEGAQTEDPYRRGPVFLNLQSWASEVEQEDFYADPGYQSLNLLLHRAGSVQALALEPS